MNELHEQLAQRTAQVRRRMEEACRAAGRAPESVQLCAASKTQTADTVRAAWNAGIDVFGENRVQELVEKRAAAKKAKDWAAADALRAEIAAKGWAVKDTAQGPQLSRL